MIGNLYEPAAFAEKTAELAQKVIEHYTYLKESGQLKERIERKAMMEINDALRSCILEPVLSSLTASGELKDIAEKIRLNIRIKPQVMIAPATEVEKKTIQEGKRKAITFFDHRQTIKMPAM